MVPIHTFKTSPRLGNVGGVVWDWNQPLGWFLHFVFLEPSCFLISIPCWPGPLTGNGSDLLWASSSSTAGEVWFRIEVGIERYQWQEETTCSHAWISRGKKGRFIPITVGGAGGVTSGRKQVVSIEGGYEGSKRTKTVGNTSQLCFWLIVVRLAPETSSSPQTLQKALSNTFATFHL